MSRKAQNQGWLLGSLLRTECSGLWSHSKSRWTKALSTSGSSSIFICNDSPIACASFNGKSSGSSMSTWFHNHVSKIVVLEETHTSQLGAIHQVKVDYTTNKHIFDRVCISSVWNGKSKIKNKKAERHAYACIYVYL